MRVRAKLGNVRAYHLDAARKVVPSAPAGCGMAGLTWLDGPLPAPAWPDDRYLVVHDGLGHEFAGAGGQAMALILVTFVLAKIGR